MLAADAAFVAVLAYLFRPWLVALVGGTVGGAAGDATGLVGSAAGDAGLVGTAAWVALVAVATLALAWVQLEYTRREALGTADARRVSSDEYPNLQSRLRRLAQTAEMTPPDLAVAETETANCFTVGDVRGGTVVVSTGLLEALSADELDAVLAHELAHLRNRDAAVMTLATFLPALANDDYSLFRNLSGSARTLALGLAAVVGYAASTALVAAPPFSVASLLAFGAFVAFSVLFGGVALGLLALPVAILSGHLSRYREFAADRAGAVLAGNPAALASALEKLDADASSRPTADVRASGVRELCLLPHGIVRGEEDGSGGEKGIGDDPLAGLPLDVATHPATEERISRLRALASEREEMY